MCVRVCRRGLINQIIWYIHSLCDQSILLSLVLAVEYEHYTCTCSFMEVILSHTRKLYTKKCQPIGILHVVTITLAIQSIVL